MQQKCIEANRHESLGNHMTNVKLYRFPVSFSVFELTSREQGVDEMRATTQLRGHGSLTHAGQDEIHLGSQQRQRHLVER